MVYFSVDAISNYDNLFVLVVLDILAVSLFLRLQLFYKVLVSARWFGE